MLIVRTWASENERESGLSDTNAFRREASRESGTPFPETDALRQLDFDVVIATGNRREALALSIPRVCLRLRKESGTC